MSSTCSPAPNYRKPHLADVASQPYGIDGCKAGWVVASYCAINSIRFTIVEDLAALFASDVVAAIDIPIGLPISGPRACDLAARKMLPGQGSKVFPVPSRASLAASSYRECCDVNEAACGKRLSKQTFAIMPKIVAVDRLVMPSLQSRVREAHPEVSFRLIGSAHLEHSNTRLLVSPNASTSSATTASSSIPFMNAFVWGERIWRTTIYSMRQFVS